jgi:hypothetical protein
MSIGENFKILLEEDCDIFATHGSLDFGLEMVEHHEGDIIALGNHDHVLFLLGRIEPFSLQSQSSSKFE